jgi:hypothetical protein
MDPGRFFMCAMEGTNCADDMKLLHERIENRFSFPFSSDLGFGRQEIGLDPINIRSILGVIEEDEVMVSPASHQQAVFMSRKDRLTQVFDTSS